jgi:hypothetical protein
MKSLATCTDDDKNTDGMRTLSLSPAELRCLYFLKEKHVDELVCAVVDLDEGQRRLALGLVKALVAHRRSMLS